MPERNFDIVIYGATGFTGRQAAAYLAEHAPDGLRWTIAGRRADALEAVGAELGLDVDSIVADSRAPETVAAMVAQTRVLVTTAGPFARYGSPVVAACVEYGTHYVDITGETPWVADMVAAHHDKAHEEGTRIVPCCGFDSVPSDLGTWWLVQQIRERAGSATRSVRAAFSMYGGGLNGGTAASMFTMADDGQLRRMADPFLLVPGKTTRERWSAHADPKGPVRDEERGRWLAPFFMAPTNTRVVRRSAWLADQSGESWGDDFAYQEYVDVPGGSRARALALTAALGIMPPVVALPWARSLLKRLAPKPGEGPSEAAMDKGGFRVIYRGEAEEGQVFVARMDSPGDAGNRSTVRFLCEAALTLACDGEAIGLGEPGSGGVLTPSIALGAPYLERLRAQGVRLELTSADASETGSAAS